MLAFIIIHSFSMVASIHTGISTRPPAGTISKHKDYMVTYLKGPSEGGTSLPHSGTPGVNIIRC